ncbi:unnamed protein product [Prunus armeniaca]
MYICYILARDGGSFIFDFSPKIQKHKDDYCFSSRPLPAFDFFCISTMPCFGGPLQALRHSQALSTVRSPLCSNFSKMTKLSLVSVRAVSDTGVGSCLEEFGGVKLRKEAFSAQIWDGLLFVTATSIADDEIYHYQFNLKENVSARRLTRLPSNPKNGLKFRHANHFNFCSAEYFLLFIYLSKLWSKFLHVFFFWVSSGTEVCLSIIESIDVLVAEFSLFFQKILILKIPNVAIELVVEHGHDPGSRYVNVFLANECNPLSIPASNLERLKSGLEDYVFKHGNTLSTKCELCFSSWEHLKVGSGVACCTEGRKYSGSVMEAVIVISEISEVASTCPRTHGSKTEVLYFKDFSPCPIPQFSLKALTSIDWKSYGLSFGSVVVQGGFALVEWENLPPYVQIDIVLHHYHEQYPYLDSILNFL